MQYVSHLDDWPRVKELFKQILLLLAAVGLLCQVVSNLAKKQKKESYGKTRKKDVSEKLLIEST